MTGRVIIGDIAATLADLSVRGLLQAEVGADSHTGGWTLTRAAVLSDGSSSEPLAYEEVLLDWLPRPGFSASLASLLEELPSCLDEVRTRLVRDAIHRGWLRHLHHERTDAALELARRIRVFQASLRNLTDSPGALPGNLLPYALHFGMADPEVPLVRFAHAWVTIASDLPGWRQPPPQRPDPVRDAPATSKPSIDEQMMGTDVGAMIWLTGGW